MLTVTQLKKQFLAFFRLLASTDTYLDVSYKKRVYRIYVEDLGRDAPKKKYKKRRAAPIQKSKCASCGGMVLNGVCMDPKHSLA